MPMRAHTTNFQRLLAGFLVTTLLALFLILALPALLPSALVSVSTFLTAACILLGLVWLLVGYAFTPTVETYLGQGAMEGVPIIGPLFANPERNPPVLTDLAWKLSAQTDAGIVLAALGFGLMTAGFAFYLAPAVGFVILAVLLLAVAVVLLLALFGRPSAAGSSVRAPPNP